MDKLTKVMSEFLDILGSVESYSHKGLYLAFSKCALHADEIFGDVNESREIKYYAFLLAKECREHMWKIDNMLKNMR